VNTQTSRSASIFSYDVDNNVLDEINLRLLRALAENPRLPMTALARIVGMSSPAVTDRVRRLEDAGVIQGYRLDIDPKALGLPLTTIIRVRPNPGQLGRVAELIHSIPEVVECHRITGDDCFILTVHLPAMDQLDRLLDRILLYGVTTTSIVQTSPVPRRAVQIPYNGD
jgi:Lrp/AsnC family transcriptional regulator, leucine-responsive regulatory protein